MFISNAHISDHLLVVCRTTKGEKQARPLDGSSFPPGTDGVGDEAIETMGGRETNHLYFNDCEVSAEQLLGEQDRR